MAKKNNRISDSIRNDKEHKMKSLFVLESILTAGGHDMFLSIPIHFLKSRPLKLMSLQSRP